MQASETITPPRRAAAAPSTEPQRHHTEPPPSQTRPLIEPATPARSARRPAAPRTAPQGPNERWLIFVGVLVALAVIREGLRRAREHPVRVTRGDSAAAMLLAREGLRQLGSSTLGGSAARGTRT